MTDVFTAATTATTSTEQNNQQTESGYIEQLVGDGKKFKDVEALAKGKLEADRHISEITQTLAELREEVAKQDYAKDLLAKLQNKGTESGTVNSATENNTGNSASGNTTQETSIEALVEQAILKKEQSRSIEQNIATANEAVVAQYGEKAAEVVKAKAQELGISVERLKEIAAESPTAFLQLVGGTTKKVDTSVLPKSSIRTESMSSTPTDRTFEFYQKMRRDNKSLYYSPKIQRTLMEDRQRLGDKFYN